MAQRYLALIDNTNEIIYSHDLQGNYTSLNRAGELITGYTRAEALRLTAFEIVAPEFHSLVRRMIEEKRAGAQSSFYELEIITKEGRRLPLEVSTHLIYEGEGPIGVQGIARDITARKKRERDLIESEQRYKQLVDEATDIIYRIDLTGHFTFVNPIASKFMQRPIDELVGLHFQELIRPDYRQPAADFYRRQISEKIPATYFEFPAVTKEGREIWIGQNVQLLMPDGLPVELQAVARDITARKEAQARLVESERRYRSLFNFTPLSMTLVSVADLRVIDVNNSFLELNNLDRADVIDRPASELKLWGEADTQDAFLQLLHLNQSVRDYELQTVDSEEYERTYLVSAEIIDLQGIECILSLSNDITEHRALEDQLRQSQRMEAIGQLAGGIAHDFNNMLTAISGYSQLSLRLLGIHHPVSKNIEEIRKAGNRAASLTRQLLAFSRRQLLQAKVIEINGLVAEMELMLKRVIDDDIDLVTILKPEAGNIKADPGQIEQVLLNLVVNARDAMPKGGRITIETAAVELDESYSQSHRPILPGSYVLLAVSDSGVGIDAVTQKRIFEPFFTTKEVGKGTGLGLSTVYGIVKQSAGYIWVYSEVGIGTTFKIYLPRISQLEENKSVEVLKPEPTGGNESILIVEDEDLVRTLLEEILLEHGYSVTTAVSGQEALRLCESLPAPRFDLVITDLVMPAMSGTALAEHLSSLQPQARILFISGYTNDAVVRHGVLENQVFFLQKPFTPTSLAEKVREVLDSPSET